MRSYLLIQFGVKFECLKFEFEFENLIQFFHQSREREKILYLSKGFEVEKTLKCKKAIQNSEAERNA